MNIRSGFALIWFVSTLTLFADGPTDNQPDKVRRVPPPGIAISTADRAELEAGVAQLGQEIDSLRASLKGKRDLLGLLPDVQIYYNAVHYALAYDEIYKTNEVRVARELLKEGTERGQMLRDGKPAWTNATGLIVRGYVSKIDGSVQPYGLVVPPTYRADSPAPYRLDAWFHGRGETLTELDFLNGRRRSPGEFTPANAIVLHLYGRYCNANKFAGEIDLLEALDHVKRHYPIDENRLVVRGFSMGGAACWQFAVHYAGLWAAAAPGAGFSETADFLKVFQQEAVKPAPYEQKLWHWYDSTDYALNLFNCPTVAYSGEIDGQKQAADMMAKALAAEGMELTHIIGPQTKHQYHPDSKIEINRRIDQIVARGRNPIPNRIHFTTWTLRYNQMLWLTVDEMEKHWERARVDAEILNATAVKVTTTNVSAFTLSMPSGLCPLDNTRKVAVLIDGREFAAAPPQTDRSWTVHFRKIGKQWAPWETSENTGLRKRHGLQGPIDDAFMESFIMVRPTGQPLNEKVGAWSGAEMTHAIDHWRRQFRGEARVLDDTAVTDADIAGSNLVLWGDPHSNRLLAKIVDKLPVEWSDQEIKVGRRSYSADHHVPVLIYPNPLNPHRYVVLNSGFTFREYDYLNNARQIAKLPDFAVIDVNQPVTSRAPGGIATAGFFGEHWDLPTPEQRPR